MQTAAQITGSILMLLLGSDGVTPTPHDPAFITTWDTTKDGATSSNEILISTNNSAGQYFTIDWGDGTVDENLTGDNIHAYNEPGVYTVKITGDFPRIFFDDRTDRMGGGVYDNEKLLSVENWGDVKWQSMEKAFNGCGYMVINAEDTPNLSKVKNASYMFAGATAFNKPIGDWDTSEITDMHYMFYYAQTFNQPIGDWDTSKVTNMSGMFYDASIFNQAIGGWNTSNVTDMSKMFVRARVFDQPLGDWDTSNVINMASMFSSADVFNQPIGNWNTSEVTNMSYMFYNAFKFNQPIGNWNISKVTSLRGTFQFAKVFDQPIGNWDTSKVVDMGQMFSYGYSFNQDISAWDTSSVTNMKRMFEKAYKFRDNDLSGWNVANVTEHTDFMLNAGPGNTEPIWP